MKILFPSSHSWSSCRVDLNTRKIFFFLKRTRGRNSSHVLERTGFKPNFLTQHKGCSDGRLGHPLLVTHDGAAGPACMQQQKMLNV